MLHLRRWSASALFVRLRYHIQERGCTTWSPSRAARRVRRGSKRARWTPSRAERCTLLRGGAPKPCNDRASVFFIRQLSDLMALSQNRRRGERELPILCSLLRRVAMIDKIKNILPMKKNLSSTNPRHIAWRNDPRLSDCALSSIPFNRRGSVFFLVLAMLFVFTFVPARSACCLQTCSSKVKEGHVHIPSRFSLLFFDKDESSIRHHLAFSSHQLFSSHRAAYH